MDAVLGFVEAGLGVALVPEMVLAGRPRPARRAARRRRASAARSRSPAAAASASPTRPARCTTGSSPRSPPRHRCRAPRRALESGVKRTLAGRRHPHRAQAACAARRRRSGGATRVLEYNPELDGQADPGEVVWTWVAYEDDPRQGKDRPVVVVGRRGRVLLGPHALQQRGPRRAARTGSRSAPAPGTASTGRAGCASTGCSRSTRTASVAKGRSSTAGRFDAVAAVLRRDYGWT